MSYRRTQMKISVATVCLFALLGAAGSVAAENPFASTWKLNPAKSHLTGDTMEFAEAGSGAIRSTAGAISYTFKTDGTAYSMGEGSGFTAAWKQLGADAWEVTFKKDETVASVDTWKLSPDGKTINIESKGTKPNGENFDDTSVYARIAGQSGLLGTWKSTEVKASFGVLVDIKASGTDGLVLNIPDLQITCNAKFDGKDYPATGPTIANGITLALTRTDPRSFKMEIKAGGNLLGTDTYTVSADGKTMTNVSTPLGAQESQTAIYERQ